jgi:hypothetical protein
MRRLLSYGACLGVVSFAATASLANQTASEESEVALLSDKRGGFGFVGLKPGSWGKLPDNPMDQYTAKEISGKQIGSLFGQLCLNHLFDSAKYDEAVKAYATDFSPIVSKIAETSVAKPLIGHKDIAATQIVQNVSSYGVSGFWSGSNAEDLNGRFFLKYSGNLVVTGPFKAKNIYAPQCNLTVRVTGMDNASELLDEIESLASGFSSLDRREKKKYARAVWTGPEINGQVPRISASASAFHKPEQTVHLTLQLLPKGKRK